MQNDITLQMGPEGEFERKRLERLIKLQKSDSGFFFLATHSYIESWLREKYSLWDDRTTLNDLLFKFRIEQIDKARTFPDKLSILQTLSAKEKISFAVLHHFINIGEEESSAAAYRLIKFCELAGIKADAELKQIKNKYTEWESRKSIPDIELLELKMRISEILKENQMLLEEIEQLRKLKNPDERSDLVSAEQYITGLARLTNYTRTRHDFERDVTRLTPDQQAVLDGINLTDDFLIKGGAGTGKTLVLIKALEKAASIDKNELSFCENETSVRLLTYNRTLAKYDKYIANVLEQGKDAGLISTVDKYLYDKLKEINKDFRIIFSDNYITELVSDINTTDNHNDIELANEIDNIIFARGLSKNDYLNPKSSKKGEREEIWKIRELVIEKMNNNMSFTKNYSRHVILNHIKTTPDNSDFCDIDFAFIDEVQDLTAVDLKTVKACSRRAVIMAGDSDQSIYQSGFTFSQADIDIRGTTKILKTNFRNTIEIQALAEKYRLKSSTADKDSLPEAFRTGPQPELYTAADNSELTPIIIKRVKMFIEDLKYDPENLCILVPSSKDIDPMQKALSIEGIDGRDLRNEDFSFTERNIIRISTMHSSKGLDFPVVLLNLHKLPQTSASAGADAQEKMKRNLIYVSMTRAMDHLNVFTIKDDPKPEISDLVELLIQSAQELIS